MLTRNLGLIIPTERLQSITKPYGAAGLKDLNLSGSAVA